MRVSVYLCPDNQAPCSKLPIKWIQTNASYVIMVRCAKHFRLVICLITSRLQPTLKLNRSLSQEQLSPAPLSPCLSDLSCLICLSASARLAANSSVLASLCRRASARIFAQTTKHLAARFKQTQPNASYVIIVRCAKHFRLVICLITCRLQPT